VEAKRHVILGTNSASKVIAIFDKAEILDAVGAYGNVELQVKGKLNSGRSFLGKANVYISR